MAAQTLLIISPMKKMSGNLTTVKRIRSYLQEEQTRVLLEDPINFESLNQFQNYLEKQSVSAILALHAVKCSKFLRGCPLPYSIILGGTDVNGERETFRRLHSLFLNARYVIGFSKAMLNKVKMIMPNLQHDRFTVIRQGVKTEPSSFSLYHHLNKQHCINLPSNVKIFTIIAGIRPVKDLNYVLSAFSSWHKSSNKNAYLVIIGPILDLKYAESFTSIIKQCSGVVYLGALSTDDTHAAIRDSFALLNTSISEGMSAAVLEALQLGVPVIARDIPGNRSVIENMQTGLLFSSPSECIEHCKLLVQDFKLRNEIIENGIRLISSNHNCQNEKASYKHIVDSMFNS